MPASQLASQLQSSTYQAAAAQPRNGAKKLINPTAVASFHLALKTVGSSSAPAKKAPSFEDMDDDIPF